jgi:hypothetical protein
MYKYVYLTKYMNRYGFSLDKNVKIELLKGVTQYDCCYICKLPYDNKKYYKVSWDDKGIQNMFLELEGRNRCIVCSEECVNMWILQNL